MPHPNPNSNLLTPHRISSNVVVIFPQSPHTRALKLVLAGPCCGIKIFHSTNTSVSFWPRAFSSSLSCSLSFSPFREGHGTYQPHQPMYATTQFTPQHETTQRSDTHTHTRTEHRQLPQCVSSLLAGGSRVDAAWKISTVITAKPQPRKTNSYALSASLYMCLSWFSLARRVALRGRHQGGTWPLTSISSRSPLHSNLARSWWWAGILLRVAATCFHHLLFTFPPSIFLFSCYWLL